MTGRIYALNMKTGIAAGKDGLVYGIETDVAGTGNAQRPKALKPIYQTPATTRSNTEARLTPTEFTRFCPGSQGGAEWNGPALFTTEQSRLCARNRLVHIVKPRANQRDERLDGKPLERLVGFELRQKGSC